MATRKDTHLFTVDSGGRTFRDLSLDAKGEDYSEAFKSSNHSNVRVVDSLIIGGVEDCIDLVRGSNFLFSNCTIDCSGSKQAVTVKAGFENLWFKDCSFVGSPKTAYIVAGQYSDYNFCGDLVTKDIRIDNCDFEDKSKPAVRMWNASNVISDDEDRLNLDFVPSFVVYFYFSFRKIQQRIWHGKNGRNAVCKKIG